MFTNIVRSTKLYHIELETKKIELEHIENAIIQFQLVVLVLPSECVAHN